jgi:NAD(P)-dependent dehydrogenase (short-subunit alcohol dehydrogenase family)
VERTLEKLQTVEQEILKTPWERGEYTSKTSQKVHSYSCDIRDEAAVKATVERIVADFGRIAALVNNAGGQFPPPLHRINAKGFDAREIYIQALRRQASQPGPRQVQVQPASRMRARS